MTTTTEPKPDTCDCPICVQRRALESRHRMSQGMQRTEWRERCTAHMQALAKALEATIQTAPCNRETAPTPEAQQDATEAAWTEQVASMFAAASHLHATIRAAGLADQVGQLLLAEITAARAAKVAPPPGHAGTMH